MDNLIQTIHGMLSRWKHPFIGPLLALTRGEEGRQPLLLETFDLTEMAQSIQEQFAALLSKRHIVFHQDMKEPFLYAGDQSMRSQLFRDRPKDPQ